MMAKLFSHTPKVAIPGIDATVANSASRAGRLRVADVREPAAACAAGLSDVSNVTSGYTAWEKAGLPTETSAGGAA